MHNVKKTMILEKIGMKRLCKTGKLVELSISKQYSCQVINIAVQVLVRFRQTFINRIIQFHIGSKL